MDITKKLGLKKPEESEFYDINIFNENMDTLEEEIIKLQNRPINNNLLINSNFANPVNQRGETTKTGDGYWIDRWFAHSEDLSNICTIMDGYIRLIKPNTSEGYANIFQLIEFPQKYAGKTLTASCKYRASVNSGATLYVAYNDADGNGKQIGNLPLVCDGEWHEAAYTFTVPNDTITAFRGFQISTNNKTTGEQTIDVEWAKLEFGEHATPYVPRLYEEEIQLCLRYYQTIFTRNSTLIALNSSTIQFSQRLPVKMRTEPTATFSSAIEKTLQANKEDQSGFEFIIWDVTSYHFLISCNKTSHGLTISSILSFASFVCLDAEL